MLLTITVSCMLNSDKMNCLLVSATANEISPFLTRFQSGENLPENTSIDILISGVGIMATTYSLTRQFSLKRPDLVIQAGIAGCFDKAMPLAAVVAVKKDTVADMGVVENNEFRTIFDMKLAVAGMHPYSNGWLVNRNDILNKTRLKKVSAVTVNEVTTGAKRTRLYTDRFSPIIESMEGAALHYTCIMEKIPFVQLRAISNYVGERKKEKWKMKEAIINLNKELGNLLNTL